MFLCNNIDIASLIQLNFRHIIKKKRPVWKGDVNMALQECRLNLNQKLKELRPHGTLEFPCAGYSSYYTGRQEDSIPWHWHEEIEMVYVAEGRLELKIPDRKSTRLNSSHVVISYAVFCLKKKKKKKKIKRNKT